MIMRVSILPVVCLVLVPGGASAQKWVNPNFDTHRLDYRDLGYPAVNQIAADNAPITALLAGRNGRIYGATSGKQSCLFLYDRSMNKVRPLGKIADAQGVYHCLAQSADGKIYIGAGLNQFARVELTRDFPGGVRAIEEQLWKDIQAAYKDYAGGRLYCYDPAAGDEKTRMAEDPCPLEDLGIPVAGNGIYAMAQCEPSRQIFGISYPDAHFFIHSLQTGKTRDLGPLLSRKIYSGPERTWRSMPRGLYAGRRVYTSGDDGLIVYYDPEQDKIMPTAMRLPGEYWEAWNYYGYPVVEQFVDAGKHGLFGGTSDGFLFQMDIKTGTITNLGKPRISRRVRAMTLGPDAKLYMICGEFQEPCKLYSYDLEGKQGFRDLGILAVDRSPYYAKRAYQFDAMATGIDGTIFLGESDRRASLFLFFPDVHGFEGGLNPSNPR